ncbi:hypothetical protein HELRODRAFT_166106 [Helobdella robusta]|uniref:Receptor ligand binding region domain-containing protein n=1 Tax=Helobdella robusta TaxID=6412 RepID=T1EXR8_HELRO|nr:hypothetical protein HELRODRAFT_166106 [Helobdella robusta]ESN90440.1 hypothetical protein HELRODRAFT_166106 [Helobdella robusta]
MCAETLQRSDKQAPSSMILALSTPASQLSCSHELAQLVELPVIVSCSYAMAWFEYCLLENSMIISLYDYSILARAYITLFKRNPFCWDDKKMDAKLDQICKKLFMFVMQLDEKVALHVDRNIFYEEFTDAHVNSIQHPAVDAAKLMSYLNMPWLAFASSEQILGNTSLYSTLVRLFSPYDRMGQALVKLLAHFMWSVVWVMSQAVEECTYSVRSISAVFTKCGITINAFNDAIPFNDKGNHTKLDDSLNDIKSKARIILLCGTTSFIGQTISSAYRLGMMTGEFAFIVFTQLPPVHVREPWLDYENEIPLEAFKYVIQVVLLNFFIELDILKFSIHLADANVSNTKEFLEEVPVRMAEPPWNYNNSLLNNISASQYALYLYDTVYVYAMMVDQFVNSSQDIKNGAAFLNNGRNFTLTDKKTGDIVIDYKSDRIEDYSAWQFDQASSLYRVLLKLKIKKFSKFSTKVPLTNTATIPLEADPCASTVGVEIKANSSVIFPRDVPACGFANENCMKAPAVSNENAVIIGTLVSLFFVLFFAAVVFNTFRRKKYEKEVLMMRWKIKYDEILLFNKSKFSQSVMGRTMDAEMYAMQKVTNMLTGQYLGINVVLKHLPTNHLVLSREDLLELKIVIWLIHCTLF